MAVALLRAADHCRLPLTDGQGRMIQLHNAGETALDGAVIASPFGNGQIGAAQLDAANDAMQIGAPNATSGGGTGSYARTNLNIAADIQPGGTPAGIVGGPFFGLGGTAGSTGSMGITWNASTEKFELCDTPTGVLATGSLAIAPDSKVRMHVELDIVANTCTLDTYSIVGDVYTLIDSLPAIPGDYTNGGAIASLHSPSFLRQASQNVNVGEVWVTSGGFYTPGAIRGYVLTVLAAGTHAAALWTPSGAASNLLAVGGRNCAGGTNTSFATTASGSGTGKLSFTINTLASAGYQSGAAIYAMRPFNTVFMGATQATPTCKHGLLYSAVEYYTTAMTSLVQLATAVTGGLPHGRGIHYAGNGPDGAALTEAKINGMELIVDRFADGTTSISIDAMQAMVYAAYTAPAAGGWASDVSSMRRTRRFRSAASQ